MICVVMHGVRVEESRCHQLQMDFKGACILWGECFAGIMVSEF